MKVKLLKKLRKRFSITHMPKGYVDYEHDHFNYNLMLLQDKRSSMMEYVQIGNGSPQISGMISNYVDKTRRFETERDALNFLKSLILIKVRSEIRGTSFDERINKTHKKIWYCK